MTHNKFAIGVFVTIILTALILSVWQQRAKFIDLKIGSNYYHLEIADTQAKREKGLSGRDSLGENEGMIFLLPYPARYSFWMKDMKFPLDFVWLLDDKIVDLTPTARPEEGLAVFTDYVPRLPANRVIELNSGTISKESLKIGDVIQK